MSPHRRFRSFRSRKGCPRVERVFVCDDDESLLGFERAYAIDFASSSLGVRELRLLSDGQLVWSIDVESVMGAYARMCAQMAEQAVGLCVRDFEGLVNALASELNWPEPAARVLAVRFVFPWSLAMRRQHATWRRPSGRGRTALVDRTTLRVRELAEAWIMVTRTRPSVSENGLFVAAIRAAAPFLGLARNGRGAISLVHRFLQRERRKLTSEHFRWVRPSEVDRGPR